MTTPLFLCYPKCTTCKKAQKWLDEQGAAVTMRDIAKENPTEDELRKWHKASGLPLKKFFNTSGKKYKEQHLKDKLPAMNDEEQYRLLSTDGMLVKRPIIIGDDFVLVGFKETEWEKHFSNAQTVENQPSKETEAPAPEPSENEPLQEEPPRTENEPTNTQPEEEPTPPAKPESPKVSVRAFQMKITLRGMKPPVWRRFFVPENMTFNELSEVLIRVMGWAGYHMAAFELPKSGMNIIAASWTDEMELGERNGKTVKLSDFLPAEKKFIFVYDMGDNWEHEVVIEDVRENYPALYPAVLAYEGDCPPDDSGGVWGYMEMLAEDDADTKAWLKKNSTVYNMEETNADLRKIKAGTE